MNALSKRNRLILVAVATLAVCGALWYFLIGAQRGKMTEYRQKTAKVKDQVANAARMVKAEDQVRSQLDAVTQKLREIEGGMASGDLFTWSVLTINEFRKSYESIEVPGFTKPTEGEVGLLAGFPYKAATFTITGTAFYLNLGKFLADFENSFPYMRVQNLTIYPVAAPAQNQEDREKLEFRMDIVALIKPNTPR